jgi:hypothetical protein
MHRGFFFFAKKTAAHDRPLPPGIGGNAGSLILPQE